MAPCIQTIAVLLPGVVRVGVLRVPVFGVFAAVGLVSALWLSLRTAKAAGVDAEKLWDAGMFAVVAAFVVSRVLLIAMDLRAFMAYPLLVLSLPSLTYGGMALTGVLVWLWLRWKKLPVLRVMDAWPPCAMVLWAALSLGHFVEGTDAGMPTKLPWGVVTAGDTVLGKVHPVQIYALVVAVVLCMWLLKMLMQGWRAGMVASVAMIAGGAASFGLGMLRQPVESMGDAWLDPPQWVAIVGVGVGVGVGILVSGGNPDPTLSQEARKDGAPESCEPTSQKRDIGHPIASQQKETV
jgi:phosphatidylglycerol:prolipoprotein diacylglycerol transferase